jgi:hypothetical protein
MIPNILELQKMHLGFTSGTDISDQYFSHCKICITLVHALNCSRQLSLPGQLYLKPVFINR